RGVDDLGDVAASRVVHTISARLEQHRPVPRIVERACHEAIAAADVEDVAVRRKLPDRGHNAPVAVAKPERPLFDPKAGRVAVRGIGDVHRYRGSDATPTTPNRE